MAPQPILVMKPSSDFCLQAFDIHYMRDWFPFILK